MTETEISEAAVRAWVAAITAIGVIVVAYLGLAFVIVALALSTNPAAWL